MNRMYIHPARRRGVLARLLVGLSLAMLLSSCETTGGGSWNGRSGEGRAEQLAAEFRHEEAAATYIRLATGATGVERDRLTLLAVEQWLDAAVVE